jgi:hypothetical protein
MFWMAVVTFVFQVARWWCEMNFHIFVWCNSRIVCFVVTEIFSYKWNRIGQFFEDLLLLLGRVLLMDGFCRLFNRTVKRVFESYPRYCLCWGLSKHMTAQCVLRGYFTSQQLGSEKLHHFHTMLFVAWLHFCLCTTILCWEQGRSKKIKLWVLKRSDEDEEHFTKEKCWDLEEENQNSSLRDEFRTIRELTRQFIPKTGAFKSKNGKLITETNKILDRWKDYTEELFRANESLRNSFTYHNRKNLWFWRAK